MALFVASGCFSSLGQLDGYFQRLEQVHIELSLSVMVQPPEPPELGFALFKSAMCG